MKQCSKCLEVKELDFYPKDAKGKNGYSSQCKTETTMKYSINTYIGYAVYRITRHFTCGYHSGFRLCDIVWFSLVLRPIIHTFSNYSNPNSLAHKWNNFRHRREVQYQECPICKIIHPKPIEVIECDCWLFIDNPPDTSA